MDPAQLLAAYDAQLRGTAEMQGTQRWDRDGPLHRGVTGRGGFVSYESLAGVDNLDDLIARTVAHYAGLGDIDEFEWKTRGHDEPPDLDARLRRAGLEPEEVETVMVGAAELLAVEVDWRGRGIYWALTAARAGPQWWRGSATSTAIARLCPGRSWSAAGWFR